MSDPVELVRGEPGTHIGVYDRSGRRTQGVGPPVAGGATARAALSGRIVEQAAGDEMVVAVPVTQHEATLGAVRAAAPRSAVWTRTAWLWLGQVAASLAAVAVTMLLARRQAERLARPVERLSDTSRRVSRGDFSARALPSGIPELDQLAQTQNQMVEAMATMVERERRLSTDASHQLRTPLARLDLALEAASAKGPGSSAALADARRESRRLASIVEDVLALARSAPIGGGIPGDHVPLAQLLEETRNSWHGTFAAAGRRLAVAAPSDVDTQMVPEGVGRQVLTELLQNAVRHGSGTVTVTASDRGPVVAVEVRDEGVADLSPVAMFTHGQSGAGGAGIGLAVARDLVEAAGGRLVLSASDPTTFTWLIPSGVSTEDASEPRPPPGRFSA